MMDKNKTKKKSWMMEITAYITLASVAFGAVQTLPPEGSKGLVLALFLLIAGVMWIIPDEHSSIRNQIAYLSVQTLLTTIFLFLKVNPGIFLIVFFIIAAQAMMLLPGMIGFLWIGLLAVISTISFIATAGFTTGLMVVFVYSGGYLFFGIFGRIMMQAEVERRKSEVLYEELQEAHKQLQDYVLQAEELAVAEERNRLAREMHDALGHRLTVAAVQLEGAQRIVQDEPDKAADMVGTVREQVKEALRELRQTVATLRQPLDMGLSIRQSLERLVSSFKGATGLSINLIITDSVPALPETHRLALYRTAQEALTNVQKHANARQVWLKLSCQDNLISLTFSDDGVGFSPDAEKTSFGLRGIRERISQLNGEFQIKGRPGGGGQLSVKIPLFEDGDSEG